MANYEAKNGGPAFPFEANDHVFTGMSLRDYFAAKAMHAELNTAGQNLKAAEALAEAAAATGQTIEGRIAFNSYRLADAMLKAREASHG